VHAAGQSSCRRLIGVGLVVLLSLGLSALLPAHASAAKKPVCTVQAQSARLISMRVFQIQMTTARRAFFRTHRSARARRAFVRAQERRLTSLRRAARRCSGATTNGAAEGAQDPPPPPPCSPSLFSAPYTEMNEGTTNAQLPLRPDGPVRAVMLFVDFPDLHASESTSTLFDQLVPHARTWFAEASYGRLQLDVTLVSHWIRMPQNLRRYGLSDGITWPEHHDYMADAVAAADPTFDFSGYQVVYVVAPKGSGVERSPGFQAYPGSGMTADGTELRYGATFFDDTRNNRFASNIVIHETGHILGLPDLYDIPSPVYWSLFRYAGGWDMMSWTEPGAHFFAWEKWKLGWLDPTQLTCLDTPGAVTTTISPLERAGGLKAIVVPTTASTAYVVEARKRIGQDARLCEDGVLVYSVDSGVRSGYGPVRMRAAQRDTNVDLRDRCGPLYNAPFDRAKGEVATFTDAAAGIDVDVLSSSPSGYRVRVTRTSMVTQALQPPASERVPSPGVVSEARLAPPQLSASGFPFGIAWDLGGPPVAD
jgi:M6 family metalloprotease-like protein